MSEETIQDVGTVENTVQEDIPKEIDWKVEYFDLLKVVSKIGLNIQVMVNNTEARIEQSLAKNKNS